MKKVQITTGLQAVAANGTAEALVSSSQIVRMVVISAPTSNTGIVVVGDSNVVAAAGLERGFHLDAGETVTFEFPANEAGLRGSDAAPGIDLNELYVDSVTNDDQVSWIAFNW